MTEIELRRRFFAEELEAVCKLRTPALVEAFARVPRDQFLPPGPWTVLSDGGESYMMGAAVRTRAHPGRRSGSGAPQHRGRHRCRAPAVQWPAGYARRVDRRARAGARLPCAPRRRRPRLLHGGDGGVRRLGRTGARVRSRRSARGRGHAAARIEAVDRGAPRRRIRAAPRTIRRDPRERRRHAPARHLAGCARAWGPIDGPVDGDDAGDGIAAGERDSCFS